MEETKTEGDTSRLDELPLGVFQLRITALTFGANFSDGYSLGIIGALLPQLSNVWNLSAWEQGVLASSALMGLFLGSAILGRVGDLIGRQKLYLVNCGVIAIASLAQYWANDPWTLSLLRLVIGFGLGADYAVGPTLMAEFSGKKYRGMLLSSLTVMWTVGYVAASLLGTYLHFGDTTWRWLLASGAIPAILVLIARIGTPESPAWLASKGRVQQAQEVIRKHLGVTVPAAELTHAGAEKHGFLELWGHGQREKTFFGAVFYSALVLPYFAIYTFVPSIFGGLKVENGDTQYLILNIFLLLGGIAGIWWVEATTRRNMIIVSFGLLVVTVGLLGLLAEKGFAYLLIPFVVYTFVMSAASNLTQVYPPELFPTSLRSTGVGLVNAVSRIASAAGTFVLPLMLEQWGLAFSMYAMAAVLLVGLVVSYRYAPETSQQSIV